MFLANKLNKGAGAAAAYQISRSLRFNSDDSAYLTRTPATATNQKTWTWSAWVKRGTLSVNQVIFAAGTSNSLRTYINFLPSDALVISSEITAGVVLELTTTQVFRDVSAWYNITIAIDTTQATNTNRAKIYVNGTQVTSFSAATYPSQNTDLLGINSTDPHTIGVRGTYSLTTFLPAYLTEIYLIDGQSLTPSSFGQTDAQTGVWGPKAYSGSYGTNGFYLNFSDNSNTTAATLGKDYSGNGNNWTPNNFSVTAGAGNDSLVDVPTPYGVDTGVGGTVRGNYATLNSLKFKTGSILSNGNLNLNGSSTAYFTGLSTISPSSGNYYMEMLCTGTNVNRPWGIGVIESNASNEASITSSGTYFVSNNNAGIVVYFLGATQTILSTTSTWLVGDIISLAWNVDSGKFWVGLNGVWYPSLIGGTVASNADVVAGNFPTFSITYFANTNPQVVPAFLTYETTAPIDVNFGQRPFAYTAPSGFKALCTQNLPTPTIGATTATQANTFFAPALYTGNDGTQTVTTGIDMATSGGLVWFKNRSANVGHALINPVVGYGSFLQSNTTGAENAFSFITATSSTGFTMNTGSSTFNGGAAAGGPFAYVAWNWKANGSGSTNTAGSITSTVSANTTSGFSIVTYNGTGANATVGHGLGVAPSMIIIKSRSSAGTNWNSYHVSLGNSACIVLNLTIAAASGTSFFNATTPTSTVFSLGTDGSTNPSGAQQVAYCFAPIAGYSAFGSYTGNGSADGPFVFTGFRPAFVLTKRTDSASDWQLMDSSRDTYNVANKALFPNLSDAETTGYSKDFLSNGFKIRDNGSSLNASGGTFIYMAFASAPLKFSLAR